MDERTLNQLFKLLGDAFYEWQNGRPIREQAEAIHAWMEKHAPLFLKK